MNLRLCGVAGTCVLALGGASCRVLPSFPANAIEAKCSSGQLVFHSDFPLPKSHRLVREFDRGKLAKMATTIGFDDIVPAAQNILAGKVRGRLVVEIG